MYKLMIVEDDASIRSSLEHSFDWASFGFSLCGTAANGLDALSMIPTVQPDVILTDVEMPRMSGIDLAKQLVSSGYPAKIVFLSAYDDYRYVRDSLRLGAADYLLKPLHKDTVRELLQRIAGELDADGKKLDAQKKSEILLQISGEVLPWQAVLGYLLGQRSDPDDIRLLLSNYGISVDGPLTLASLRFLSSGIHDSLFSRLQSFGLSPMPILIPYQKETVFLFPCETQTCRDCLTKILEEEHGYQCILANQAPFPELPAVFLRLCGDRMAWFYYPPDRILTLNDENAPPAIQSGFDMIPGSDTYFPLIRDGNAAGLQKVLDSHFRICRQLQVNSDIVVIQMVEIYTKTASLLQALHPELQAEAFETVYHLLQECLCFSLLCARFSEFMQTLFRQYAEVCASKGDLIERVQAFISSNYAEDLSLDYLAGHFYVNASYLSAMFSRKSGQTITAYLRSVRMERAAELLSHSRLSIAEVGSSVGYDNYHHFMRLFKSYFHVTPTEYRNRFLRSSASREES